MPVTSVVKFCLLCRCNAQSEYGEHGQVAYTFDAGPNAVLIAHDRKAASELLKRLLFYFPPGAGTDLNR